MEKRTPTPTTAGPDSWFTGAVLMDAIRGLRDGSRVVMNHVHFAPGTRTHWHCALWARRSTGPTGWASSPRAPVRS